jgi:hypothetical protein
MRAPPLVSFEHAISVQYEVSEAYGPFATAHKAVISLTEKLVVCEAREGVLKRREPKDPDPACALQLQAMK